MKKQPQFTSPTPIPFAQVLQALQDLNTPFQPRYLYRLSDLEKDEIAQLEAIWSQLPTWRRTALMEDAFDLSEDNTLLSFEALGRLALNDADAQVRLLAIQGLWEYESRDLLPIFIQLVKQDPDDQVRAVAAGALGPYVYAGELDELPEGQLRQVEDCLIEIIRSDQNPTVRQAALEAIGFSSRPEIPVLIETAFHSDDQNWQASALLAMGRSADERWQPQVLSMLDSKLPRVRGEAAQAAGELEIAEAVPRLIELLTDPNDETRQASIWSLSQIGGHQARQALQKLAKSTRDEDELDLIQEAMDNLAFTEGLSYMPLLETPDLEEDSDWEDEMENELDEEDDLFDDYLDEDEND